MSGRQRLHDAMAARVEQHQLPGMLLLVARGDDVWVDAIGLSSFDDGEPIRRETLFRITSMTKPIIAAVTLTLVEEGVLELEAPVDKWLPELANPRVLRQPDAALDDTVPAHRAITLDDLLTFRLGAGILTEPTINPSFPVVERAKELQLVLAEPDPRTPLDPDEWMRRFASLPLMYQPGERWLYNVGSLVLGVLLARAAGKPLGKVLGERIFEPLRMRHTGFWLPLNLTHTLPAHYMTNFATGHLELRGLSSPDEWSTPPPFPSGAAGLVSTADDFLAFGRMLLNKGDYNGQRVLSAESVELMTRNHLTSEQMASAGIILGGNRGWGYGLAVATEPDPAWPVPGRYGWSGGYGTDWVNDPHRGIVAIAMTQVSDFLWNGGLVEFESLVADF